MDNKYQDFINIDANKFNLLIPSFKEYSNRIKERTTIVLHWTGGSNLSGAITTLTKNNYGYHFLIEKDGTITQGAALKKRVSHAGASYGPNGKDCNEYSIGISFTIKNEKSEFTNEMYESCSNLIKDLQVALPSLEFITGHHWISPGRKIDPFTFDFERLVGTLDKKLTIWKTGYKPFPLNLSDCKCIKVDEISGNCIESVGRCIGQGGHSYSEKKISNEISDFLDKSDEVST